MNQSTQTRLKVIVERAVRPVRAGAERKRAMREELLAHVSAVFEEEAQRLGDERAALERTAERFGDPRELTGQLQQSVPEKDFGERLLGRVALLTFVWLGLFGGGEFPAFPGRALLDLGLFAAGLVFLGDVARRALRGPVGRPRRRALLIACCSLLLFLASLFLLLGFSPDAWSRRESLSNASLLAAALTWGLAAPLHEAAAALRSQLEWDSLPIE